MITKQESINAKSFRERLLLKKEIIDMMDGLSNVKYTPYLGTDKFDAEWYQTIKFNSVANVAYSTICEVKVREYPMASYETWFIEKDKYDYLMAQKHDTKLYINFHSDGIQIWDLTKVAEPQWTKLTLPANNYNDDTVVKMKGDLNKADSTKIMKDIYLVEALEQSINIIKERQLKGEK